MSHTASPNPSNIEGPPVDPAMTQQNNTQLRQSTSYPSPHSYPSPSMSAYAYPPQQQQQNVEQYRASPTGSHASMASLNLPPIRSIDPRQQQAPQPPQQTPQGSGGPPMPPNMAQMAPMPQHYGGYPGMPPHMNVTSSPHNPQMRYPIPPAGDPNKILSGGRHKKEVKRRTKTGCLTCRKRRIKCDEGHPVCRNCVKSKRDCLGYDPIFKQQAPSAIQPAPNSTSSIPSASASSSTFPPPPQGYMPATTQAFSQSLAAESPSSSLGNFDYGAAIDPALEGSASSQMASNNMDGGQVKGANAARAGPFSSNPETLNPKGAILSSHPRLLDSVDPSLSLDSSSYSSLTYASIPAKRIKIDDLLALSGIPPPPLPSSAPTSSIPVSRLEEIKSLYLNTYAPAMDKFLEVRWYQFKSLPKLLLDSRLLSLFSTLIDKFSSNINDPAILAQVQSLEASVIWSMMGLCRADLATSNGVHGAGSVEDTSEPPGVAKRLEVFEALITRQYLESNPISAYTGVSVGGTVLEDQLKRRQVDFWGSIGHFLTLHDDEASSAKEIDDTLGRCRALLDTFENRDVIYSIAIARHIGQRWADFPHNVPAPAGNDEKDERGRLYVALKFVENEQSRGTTQVIQRLCGMAVRSWTVGR